MISMLEDCNYNIVRLIADLSKISGYLKRHAIKDANDVDQPHTHALMEEIHSDIEVHIEKLRQAIEGLSKEGKFN